MERPRIKGVHHPMLVGPGLISIGGTQDGVGAELDDEDGTLWRLLGLMDGDHTRDEIIAAVPEVDGESLTEAMDAFIEAGYVEDAAGEVPANLSPAEVSRYDRALNYFAWVDMSPRLSRYELQSRLKAARVTVCGLGGTGSAVAASLVAAGVGDVHCVDFDRVEPGNLSRQLLYTEADVGAAKVATAVERLRSANRHAEVTGEERKVAGPDDLADLMAGRDLLVLAADEPRSVIARWANEAGLATGTPWQIALYAGPTVVTGLFVPGVTPCYGCLPTFTEHYRDIGAVELFPWDGHAVLAPSANLTGHLAALEAVHFLTGLTPSSLGRVFHLSLTDLTRAYYVEPKQDVTCASCGREPS
ncbi:ThiF family adenylyltransferase [Nonomuraea sp. NBC_01738]|uniref:HesA/MoeB/ThiF family protein n=1 Tax=Nonomuraea sp. NBC_01738 TaxID=2976003 RepID=UPI002E1367CA|nr:ThiF family adenylyltransferase [Nonomuraea sp. NBC_01738]